MQYAMKRRRLSHHAKKEVLCSCPVRTRCLMQNSVSTVKTIRINLYIKIVVWYTYIKFTIIKKEGLI